GRETMGVLPHVQGTVDSFPLAIVADRLRDRENVRLRERPPEWRAAVAARAEGNQLVGVVNVRRPRVVFAFEPGWVNEQFGGGWFAGQRGCGHGIPLPCFPATRFRVSNGSG